MTRIAFQTDTGTLYQGPCEDVLAAMPADSVDTILADPPYSSGGFTRADRTRRVADKYQNSNARKYYPDFAGDSRDQISYAMWCAEWLRLGLRVVRPGGVAAVWSDWRQVAATQIGMQMAGWVLRGMCVWDKTEGCRPQKGRYRNQCEYVVWGTKGPAPTEGEALPGCFRKMSIGKDKHHIAGKPVEIMAQLARICPPGGLVLEPFFGSGSTGVACEIIGRRWIGVEIEDAYIEISRQRLAEPAAVMLPGVG